MRDWPYYLAAAVLCACIATIVFIVLFGAASFDLIDLTDEPPRRTYYEEVNEGCPNADVWPLDQDRTRRSATRDAQSSQPAAPNADDQDADGWLQEWRQGQEGRLLMGGDAS